LNAPGFLSVTIMEKPSLFMWGRVLHTPAAVIKKRIGAKENGRYLVIFGSGD
jgi:hypothetical protein